MARLLYCHCAYAQVVPPSVKGEVLRRLAEAGVEFDAVPDLCELSARRDPQLIELAAAEEGLRIAACYPRAVRWLFAAAGAPLPEANVEVINMRVESAESVASRMLAAADGEGSP